ncbi:DUF835 domain-containing protein [Candidatus Woesearchaeota archaeon]|nr:DUF835 domain-containing protein [Candidatus Woesearchaeota archaeon]
MRRHHIAYSAVALFCIVFGLVLGFHGSVGWTNAIRMISLIAFLAKLGLALWIYVRNPYARVNQYFAIVFLGQAIWDLGKFIMWLIPDAGSAIIWAKISYTGYIVSVFFLISFVWAFLKKKNFMSRFPGNLLLFGPMAVLLISLWFSNLVIIELVSPTDLAYGYGIELWDYSFGPMYNYFFLWFQVIPFLYAFVLFVFRFVQTTQKDKRKQLFYLVLGSSFPIMIGIPTGVVLPAMGINLPPHNNILSLIMSIFIAIGIIKYKFLSIQPISETGISGKKVDTALARQYRIEPGNCYYIKHEKSYEISYKVLMNHLYQKEFGLIITAHNPSTIRHEYGIESTPIVWITDTDTEHLSVEPIDLEQIYETVRRFAVQVPNAFVLIDGLDYLVTHNNFEKVLHFIKQVKGSVLRSDDCLILPKGALELSAKQEKILESEFEVLPSEARARSRARRSAKEGKKKNYIVIGHNPLAQSIISEFEKRCIVPTIIEKSEILVHYPKKVAKIIKGDPLSTKVLVHAGIAEPNTVVLVTLENDSDVILAINKLRQLSEEVTIITNINNHNFVPIAIKAGADKVIPGPAIGGKMLSLALTSPDIVRWVMDATTLAAKELELVEVKVDSRFARKSVQGIDRSLGRVGNIIAVRDVDGLKLTPEDQYILKEGDSLVLVVNLDMLPRGKDITARVHKALGCRCRAELKRHEKPSKKPKSKAAPKKKPGKADKKTKSKKSSKKKG